MIKTAKEAIAMTNIAIHNKINEELPKLLDSVYKKIEQESIAGSSNLFKACSTYHSHTVKNAISQLRNVGFDVDIDANYCYMGISWEDKSSWYQRVFKLIKWW